MTSILPDGNYRATIPHAAFMDSSNNPLTADFQFTFKVLAGDANRDTHVNFQDLLVLAGNYNQSSKTFSQGNFDYNAGGNVNFADLLILAQRYGTTLTTASAASAPSTPLAERSAREDRAVLDEKSPESVIG
jgi:hypothetical protein